MREKLAWVSFALLLMAGIYGLFTEGFDPAHVWAPIGAWRFLLFTLGFGIWTLAFRIMRPAGFLPATVFAALLYGIWWAGIAAVAGPIFFIGSCWLLGSAITPRATTEMAVLLGLSIWIFVISLAISFPIHRPAVYIFAIAVPYLVFRRRLWNLRSAVRLPAAPSLATVLLAFLLTAHFLVALKPETSADGLSMHLAAPEWIASHGKWDFDFQHFAWALMPMGADWAYTAGYMLGGETGARLLNLAMLVLLTVMIRRTAIRWVSADQATLAAALFASTPLVQLVTGSLFVENMWAAIIFGAVVSLLDGELIWAGLLLGAALSIKIGTAAFLGPAVVAGVTVTIGESKWRQALAGIAMCVVLAAPPYVSAWYKTGNPVYPFLNHIFKAPSFDSDAPFQETRFRQPLTWNTPYLLTFRSEEFFEGEKGAMGFQYFLLLLPSALLIRRRPQLLVFAIALSAAILLFRSQPNLRYLYPAMALLAVALAEFPSAGVLAGTALLNIVFLPAAGYYHREFSLPSREAAESYLESGHPQRKLIAYLNDRAPGEPAAFFDGNAIAGFRGIAYTDHWHSHPFAPRLPGWGKTADLRLEFERLGVRNIVAPVTGKTRFPVVNEILRPLVESPIAVSGRYAIFRLPDSPGATNQSPAPLAAGDYDSPNELMEYSGAWSHLADFPGAHNGTLSYSAQAGSAVRVQFTGTGIEYRFTRAFNRGIAAIRIDGIERGRVDLYDSGIQWRQSWRLDTLDPGVHTMEIRVTGEKSQVSSGTYVDVDQITVIDRASGR